MALDDENSTMCVKPSLFASWMLVDYDDLVSFQEKWDNVGRTEADFIGQKTVFTEKNNVINLTVRGPKVLLSKFICRRQNGVTKWQLCSMQILVSTSHDFNKHIPSVSNHNQI